jgi:hypothetical protein
MAGGIETRVGQPKFPLARGLLVAWLGWWTLSLGTDWSAWCFLDYVNLAFHEAGHLFLGFAGKTVTYLGGTLGQLAVPALLCGYFLLRQGQPFAAALCAWWLGENLINISIYMADARSLALPLVGGGDHDWNELFFGFGLLAEPEVARVSALTRGSGVVLMLLGLCWAGYFLLPSATRERVRNRAAFRWRWSLPLLDG